MLFGKDAKLPTEEVEDTDNRLWVIEPEFSQVLAICNRKESTLSQMIRKFWDIIVGETYHHMTRANKIECTDPHVSITGHITPKELKKRMNSVEIANGFGNRFLYLHVESSKAIPFPNVPLKVDAQIREYGNILKDRIAYAEQKHIMQFDEQAEAVYDEIYRADHKAEKPETLVEELLARELAHTMILSMIYAILDGTNIISLPHLKAALAIVRFSRECVEYFYGDSTGNDIADTIYETLAEEDRGYTQGDIRNEIFNRNKPSGEIKEALKLLMDQGKIFEYKDFKNDDSKKKKTHYRVLKQ